MENIGKFRKIIAVFGVLILSVIIFSISYSYIRKTTTQDALNQAEILKCLNTTITDETSAINLTDEFPISNEEGMQKDPYTFKITNHCDIFVYANISIDVLSSSTLNANYVKVLLDSDIDESTPQILGSLENGTSVATGATNYIIKTENMIFPNDSLTFDLRMWMDEGTTMEQGFNKTFESKIVIAYSPTSIPTHVTFRLPSNPSGLYETSFAGAQWNMKTSSLEISSLNGDLNNIELTNASPVGATNFAEYIMSLDGTNQGNGKLVNETIDVLDNLVVKNNTYYTNVSNTEFTWDETNNTYTSTNKTDNSTGTLTFRPSTSGIISLCYTVSSESGWDIAKFYVDNVIKNQASGNSIGCVNLGNLTTSNTVKVTYTKDGGTSVGNDNVVITMNTGTTQVKSAGYRYQGKNPNNWIMFNGEYWQIIGVFDSATHGREGENLVKIMRNEEFHAAIIWDKYENNWQKATLKKLLNDYYYNGINEQKLDYCYVASGIPSECDFEKFGITRENYREMIENVTWKLGGLASEYLTAKEFYLGERGTTVYSDRPTQSLGYIGLIYPSDYGYSVLSDTCPRYTNLDNYYKNACGGKTWLQRYLITITPTTSHGGKVFTTDDECQINIKYVDVGHYVYPTLYLKANVKKISGNGSFSDPYIIIN